jgi:integrase/recombinase XerD
MLSYLAGLRVGEIAALRWGDLLDGQGRAREQLRLSAAVTKGGHARVVFMNARLRREIEQFRSSLPAPPSPSQPVLITQKRTAFSANTLCQLMRSWYDQAGLDGGSSHSGRRWFITRLAHAGISPKAIMMLAGHRHLATTQRYIDVNDEMMRSAVEVL